MDTREMTTEYRLAQWAQTIQTRAQSGQSIKEFCISTGLSRNAYFYWQKKLREAACSKIQETATKEKNCLVPSGWTQFEPMKADCAEASVSIEVSGCRIIANADTNLELLAKVCQVLRSL